MHHYNTQSFPGRGLKSAFGLLELLLSLAIVAIVAALLFASVGKLSQSARSTRCLSQLRQVTSGLLSMAADSGNRISSGFSGNNMETSEIWGWQLENRRYIPIRSALRCPAGYCTFSLSASTWAWQTYGLNMYGPAGAITTTVDRPRKVFNLKLANLEAPAQYLLLADSGAPSGGQYSQTFRIQRETGGVHLRHGGKLNATFADGHAESLSYESVERLTKEARIPIYQD